MPFTDSTDGRRLQAVLSEAGVAAEPSSDAPDLTDRVPSYLGRSPGDPAGPRRYVDAALRAITVHVLLPVGDDALSFVLEAFTTRARNLPHDADHLHATEVGGRGFLVVPVGEPARWADGDAAALTSRLAAMLDRDYRQTTGAATRVG